MKRLYTSILLTFLCCGIISAQCRIDSFSNNFGYAPVVQAIPCMHRGTALNSNNYVLQVYLPISEPVPPITYHYMTITGFSGLPQGISYSKYPSQDTIWPGGRQCFIFQGTTNDTIGQYPLTTLGKIRSTIIGVDTTFSITTASQILHTLPIANYSGFDYYFSVCPAAGVENIGAADIRVYPNPTSNYLNIDKEGNDPLHGVLTNVLGKELSTFVISDSPYRCDISTLPAGIYDLHIYKNKELLKVYKIVKDI